MRVISFEEAKGKYPHRFTMDHVPYWATACFDGKYYAPQYQSDLEWYEKTIFPGERHLEKYSRYCESLNQSWPLGKWLDQPYKKEMKNEVV